MPLSDARPGAGPAIPCARMDENWLPHMAGQQRFAPSGVSAQALYSEFVKVRLGPALRELGFTGSAGRYALPASGCWALLGLQKSAYSSRAEVDFTVNLLVVREDVWTAMRERDSRLPKRPSAGALYGAEVAQSRIGRLLPSAADTWWSLSAFVDKETLADEVIDGVETYALPWLRGHLSENADTGQLDPRA